MANLVYCNDNQLLKNNYYFALSTTPTCNPTQLPSSHTIIANSGASGFYFAPGALISNLNLQGPAVGVWVANSLPEISVASATLASAPSLPPAAMQGHVMPSFPHNLIGLGPFANLGCQSLFTKTALSVIHPDGLEGPRLWRFPLQVTQPSLPAIALFEKYEDPGPRGTAANFLPTPPIINAIGIAPTKDMQLELHLQGRCNYMPPPCKPSPMASTALLHSSQRFSAVDDAGQACFVS
jgi:hypothetical protein